jgi:uncharacterized protein
MIDSHRLTLFFTRSSHDRGAPRQSPPLPRESGHSSWSAELAPAAQWTILVGLSALLGFLLTRLGIPAALLLAPMAAGIVLASGGAKVQVPRSAYALAQGIIGCMIAKMLPLSLSISGSVASQWPLLVAGILSVIAASAFLGWLMTRLRVLPGTTIVWGLSPGAATVMTLMAESHGADAQLVAFMQYLRVIMVAAIASVIARVFGAAGHPVSHAIAWFPAVAWLPLAGTLLLAVLGALAARYLRLRAGALLLPLVGGIFLTHHGLMTIKLPRWLLAASYSCVGWQIGSRFTRPLLIHAAKALPRIFACTLALIALCGLLAVLLVAAGIDPMTAYLATSPGGADSVAIIAASSKVDVPFVMTMQSARFVVVLFLGPALAKFIARQANPDQATSNLER